MTRRPLLAIVAVLVALGAACGDDDSGGSATAGEVYGAQVASYDLAAGSPQRFLLGLLAPENRLIVGGELSLDFRYLGEGEPDATDGAAGEPAVEGVTATFTTVADGQAPPAGEGPRTRRDGEGVGVYEATGVVFEDPGYWTVTATGTVDGEAVEVTAAFEVAAENRIVTAGDAAPRTQNLLPGDPDAPPTAVDSRADDDGTVPDPALHQVTVADAIATGRPTMVVVSTPVFCVSRFCGPITDTVAELAASYAGRASFVHIEVWRDFEANALNRAAAEWIYPDEAVDPAEPWVFLIDGAGTVIQRWDNVANAGDLERALQRAIS